MQVLAESVARNYLVNRIRDKCDQQDTHLDSDEARAIGAMGTPL